MLSPALSQVLERARTRFGLEVEILDGELRNLYPETGTELGRLLSESPELRQSLREVLAGGHPRDVEGAGQHYRVYPLRHSERLGRRGGLLAVRGRENRPGGNGNWPEFARAAVEVDLSAGDALLDERQQSRRLLAILRFMRYLVETSNEGDLTKALVQAAAVWFDVDARVYRRDLSDEFIPVQTLPSVDPTEASQPFGQGLLNIGSEVRRLSPSAEVASVFGGTEVVFVPLAGSSRTDWVLTLSGAVPPEADSVFQVVGRIVGVQLELLRTRRIDEARRKLKPPFVRPASRPSVSP